MESSVPTSVTDSLRAAESRGRAHQLRGPIALLVKPSGDRKEFPNFDGLRAFAALAVLLVHAAFYSGFDGRSRFNIYTSRLEVGVSVFFVISGFLLYRPFAVAHLSNRPAPKATRFWIRRLLRIVPAYWLALTFIVYVLHDASIPDGWSGIISHYAFLQIYVPTSFDYGLTQSWSLCTEMSFYLFLPLYAVILVVRHRLPLQQFHAELIGICALVGVSVIFRGWTLDYISTCGNHCLSDPALRSTMTEWLPAYFDLFALGMLLAVTSAWWGIHRPEPGWLQHWTMPWVSWSLALSAFWAVAHLGISPLPLYLVTPAVNLAKESLYGVFAFFLVLPAVFGPQQQGAIRKSLQLAPIAWMGAISYGIYLWHQAWVTEFFKWTGYREYAVPLWILLGFVLMMSIASSSLSYSLMEHPILNLKNRLRRNTEVSQLL